MLLLRLTSRSRQEYCVKSALARETGVKNHAPDRLSSLRAGYRAAIGGTVAAAGPCTRHAVDRSLIPMPARWRQAAGARASWATTCKWLSLPSIKHHLIVTHDVTNVGTNRSQLASVAAAAMTTKNFWVSSDLISLM